MNSKWIALLFAWLLLGLAHAKPIRPDTKSTVPNIAGKCVWGTITQARDKVSIDGHPNWSATGAVKRTGFVHLVWVCHESGREGPGVYKIDGDRLSGAWGWQGQAAIDGDDICGEIMGDEWRIER